MENNKQFIRTDIAKLSKSPAVVSLSECPNYVEFKKQEQYFYMNIVGNGYDPTVLKLINRLSITFFGSENVYIFTSEKEEEILSRSLIAGIYTYEIIGATHSQIAQRLTDCFNQCEELIADYNIEQVKDLHGNPDEKGTIIKFGLKEGSKIGDRPFYLGHQTTKESFNKYFAEYSENIFSTIEENKITLKIRNFDFEKNYKPDPTANTDQQKKDFDKYVSENSTIEIIDKVAKNIHSISGTKNKEYISNSIFYISDNIQNTANNIKECLQQNSFIVNNFEVRIPFNKTENKFTNNIEIIPLDPKNIQECNINSTNIGFIYPAGNIKKDNNDSIFNGSPNAAIEIEIYTNTDSLLGENIFPENSMGTYMTTLRKSYHGKPLWFDLNALIANRNTYSSQFLDVNSWCDAGTVVDYRFIARRFDGTNREPFYISDVLYSITGYDRNLNDNQMVKYIYNTDLNNKISPLSNKLLFTHIPNQTQYFNFILSDKKRKREKEKDISLIYRLYSQSNRLIYDGLDEEKHKRHLVSRNELAVINTIKLDIDSVIEDYKNRVGFSAKEIGYVEVTLCHTINKNGREEEKESEKMTFQILPGCLHKVNDFAFLNALGGWSSFNFGGDQKTDFKASPTSIFKTQIPHYKSSDEIESVYSQDIKEQFSVKTTPINFETVEWLKEMSASKAVYELSTKRYIIVDEMNIQPNSKDELFTVEMKYRYSDSFNGRVQ